MGKSLKKTVYGAGVKIANQVRTRTGFIGKTIGGVETVVEDVADGAVYVSRQFQDMGKMMSKGIKRQQRRIATRTRLANEFLDQKAKTLYENIDRTFFTDEKFDPDKAKEALRNSSEAVRRYGVKAYKSLTALVAKGKDAIVTDFRSYVPTAGELRDKYSGIGDEYDGTLLREHYESCLAFDSQVNSMLPKGSRYKAQIRTDIKASASSCLQDLREYYAKQVISRDERCRTVPDKLKILDKYFPD